jgi:biopolymer transport protein ExbD
MAMNMNKKDEEIFMEMNTTPLIDVMLVLLVMLIITIPPQLNALGLNMPVPTSEVNPAPPQITHIDIDDSGKTYVDGDLLSGKQALELRMSAIAAKGDQMELYLKPSKKTQYKYVISVMTAAQKFGLNKIAIVGNERFVD